jgi:peptidoglycan hydrolase-like protein with peptidoglycan-binding domain
MTIDGTKIHFVEKKAPPPAPKVKQAPPPKPTPTNWVEGNDAGDRDPEMRQLRKKLKAKVFDYSDYMSKKGVLAQVSTK